MRILGPLALATTLGGIAAASERAGQIVRVEQPPRHEVFVPAGAFRMGIPEDDIDALVQQCSLAFEQRDQRGILTMNGSQTTFCELYRHELEEMIDTVTTTARSEPRRIYLGAFAIDRYEVTVAEYRKCIVAGACSLDPLIAGDERYISDRWPLVNVTWNEAQEFCRWRGGRLPTEAEWEHAARADGDRSWPWGLVERPADFNHGKERASAMRELDRSPFGLPVFFMGDPDDVDGVALIATPGNYPWGEGPYGTRDQAGNVAEWTADVHGGQSTGFMVNEATLGYIDLPSVNPRRDGSATDPRVVRGGSWRQPAFLGRANVRDPFNMLYAPDRRFSHIGFRCARSV